MPGVLFDPQALQAFQHRVDCGAEPPSHLRLGKNATPRLAAVIEILEDLGLEPVFPDAKLPSHSELMAYDVLVTGSRIKEFTDAEVSDLVSYARQGGGLLIMSNHGAPEGAANDFTRYDRKLTQAFDVDLECTVFYAPPTDGLPQLVSLVPTQEHATTVDIGEVAVNNCSSIVTANTSYLFDIPADVHEGLTHTSSEGKGFAVAIDNGIRGRVVIMSDSGFVGVPDASSPGPGLIDRADNRRFINNVISWLASARAE